MLPELLQKVSLFRFLYVIDSDLAEALQKTGCPYCSGPLHQSNYERKPRGGPKNVPEEYMVRFSLCCGQEGCRRRTMPPSCRFMGRHVYWSCVMLLSITLRQNRPNSASARKLEELFGVSRNTIQRWMTYFLNEFPVSRQWKKLRGRINSTVKNDQLPKALVDHFQKYIEAPQKALIECLKFLASG